MSLELSVARGSQLLKVLEVNLGVALLGTRNEEFASSSHRKYLNSSVTNTSQKQKFDQAEPHALLLQRVPGLRRCPHPLSYMIHL